MDMSTEIGDGAIMDYFVSMLLIGVGVALLATGLFTSYFGAGKSQKIGFALFFLGIVTIAYFIVFYPLEEDIFIDALVSGVAALSGMIIGMVLILFIHTLKETQFLKQFHLWNFLYHSQNLWMKH